MADEQHFPTAIVRAQPGSPAQRFDKLARVFGDPMAKLFSLQGATLREYRAATDTFEEVPDHDMQFRAAAELMPYRYPKLKIQENRGDGLGAVATVIQINIGAPPPAAEPATIDVTPPPEEDPLA